MRPEIIHKHFSDSNIHIVKVKKNAIRLKLVLNKSTVSEAVKVNQAVLGINAAFYDIETLLPLFGFKSNEYEKEVTMELPLVVIDSDGSVRIVKKLNGNELMYFQTGPILVWNKIAQKDYSFFKENENLFDCYLNEKPAPRSVFAEDKEYYFFIAVDGRSEKSKGLFLGELTEFLLQLGVRKAINLDGGSSTTLIFDGKLLNAPSGNVTENISYGEERVVSSVLLGFDR